MKKQQLGLLKYRGYVVLHYDLEIFVLEIYWIVIPIFSLYAEKGPAAAEGLIGFFYL